MEANLKFTRETMDRVSLIKVRLEHGMSIDEVIKELRITEDEFFQYYELALSVDYNEQMTRFEAERANDFYAYLEEKENDAKEEAKKKINPLSVLSEEDVSHACVYAVDYSINLAEVRSYYLGSIENICKRFWIDFEPDMSEELICQALKDKMKEKGFHNVRNPRFMEPFAAYMEYQDAIKHKKKKDLVKFEMDENLLAIARQKIGL